MISYFEIVFYIIHILKKIASLVNFSKLDNKINDAALKIRQNKIIFKTNKNNNNIPRVTFRDIFVSF